MEPKDDLCILYEDDGDKIADQIKNWLTSDRLRFKVKICKLPNKPDSGSLKATLGIILLTPEMLEEFERRDHSYFIKLRDNFGLSALLCYDHFVNTENGREQKKLKSSFEDLETIHIGSKSRSEDFQKAILRIVQLIEKPLDPPVLKTYKLYPEEIWTANDDVLVVFKRNESRKEVFVVLKDEMQEKKYKCSRISPNVYNFSPKDMTPGTKTVEVFTDKRSAGFSKLKIHSKYGMLSHLLDCGNPEVILRRSMDCYSTDNLDPELTDMLTNGRCPSPLQSLSYMEEKSPSRKCNIGYQTLLQFGAKFGLETFCGALLELSEYSMTVDDEEFKTAEQMARDAGFSNLATILQNKRGSSNNTDEVVFRRQTSRSCRMRSSGYASKDSKDFTERMTIIWNDEDDPPEITKL